MIFIDKENRACEKTILPLKSPLCGFILRTGPQNSTAELNPRSRGPFGDHIRRSTKPPIKTQKETDLKYLIRRFHSAARPPIITVEFILRTGEKTAVSFGGFETTE